MRRTGGNGSAALDFPRHAALARAPAQPFLFVVNQHGDALTVFARDAASGALTLASTVATAPDNAEPIFVAELAWP